MNYRVLGVVVLYFPTQENLTNLKKTAVQVDGLVVVNNGCDSMLQEYLLGILKNNSKIKIIQNLENLGIATALNQGIKFALDNKFDFVLTLDQDSLLGENLVQELREFYTNNHKKQKIGAIVPNIVNNNVEEFMEIGELTREMRYVLTSGCLMPTIIFNNSVLMDEKLFIDGVDIDFSIRVRQAGYKLIRINKAKLLHSIGEYKKVNFFNKQFILNNHSPIRRYYIARNSLELVKRYLFKYPKTVLRYCKLEVFELIKLIVFSPKRLNHIKFTLRGLFDFLIRKFGKL